jgi:amino acid adenylation domain-containing protein
MMNEYPMDEVYVFPTSYAQRRLWFLDQLEPGSPLYNVYDLVPFCGALDAAVLSRALNEVVARHEALRTTISLLDGEPVQVVAASLQIPVKSVDLRSLSDSARGAEIERLTYAEYERPFDLKQGPLLRVVLLLLREEESLLLVVTHHIVSDGWSLEIFRRELLDLYDSYWQEKPSPLLPLPVQYPDYAMWQREWLQGEALETQLAYWRTRLAGSLAALELPSDRPRPAVQTYQGASQHIRLPADLTDSLKALARDAEATLFMTLLAAFFTLLHRYTGRADLLIGTPVAGRRQAELEQLIGFFVNTLVIRCNLADDPSFQDLLTRVREECLGAYANQDVPFELLVEELRPKRDPGHNPIFQVMFQLIAANTLPDYAQLGGERAGEEVEEAEIKSGTAKFDLSLDFCECNDGGLFAAIEYSTELFHHDTIRRLLRNLKVLLMGIAADPTRRLSEIPLLTDAERRQCIVEWNSTDRAVPKDLTIHQLFEAQAERTPDAVAIVSAAGDLTYRELNSRANKLARYLRRLDVGPEALVGICMKRSIGTIVAVLGILKAGGGYLPLDSAYPKERLSFMLEGVQAKVLVTEQALLDLLPDREVQIVCLDRDWEQIDREDEANPGGETFPENVAYVIYTSGSTGAPKGVMVQHASLVNFTLAAAAYGFRSTDRVLQFSSICFDTAAEEIYPCLTLGGTLVLNPTEASYSVETLLEKCREFGVTVLDLPTAVWHELTWAIAKGTTSLPSAIRMVVIGGERALPERLSMWRRSVTGNIPLMNGYGPTETTVVATVSDLSQRGATEDSLREVLIGRPIGNVQAYILDQRQQPVPVGVTGELYIGGKGLARGYVGAPELTAERFLPNAFGDTAGTRLYRTGDMVRYLASGEVEFLGRRDGQVKVRGFRVELGEVEAALRADEAVRDAVVVACADQTGNQGLAAYVVAANGNGERVSVGDLREHLKRRLPDYMVPAAFVLLDELPLNGNGKVDRQALPSPKATYDDSSTGDDAPRTEVERAIAAVWREVLSVETLGVHSNFFELGGHSLVLVRVNSKLRDLFRREIPIIDMFKYPTISSLAASFGLQATDQPINDQQSHEQVSNRAARQREAMNSRRQTVKVEAVAK